MTFLGRWFSLLFGKREFAQRLPVPSEIWTLPDRSPWPREPIRAIVIEVRDGWVLYSTTGGASNSTATLDTFLKCFLPPEAG